MKNAKPNIDMEQIASIVSHLFSNGKTPLEHYGIDGNKILEIEKRHPEIAKQIPI